MELLILYISLAILLSFLCSVLEAVMLRLTPNYLESIKHTHPLIYSKLNPLCLNIEKPLASILTINTFAHTIGAAGAGAEAQKYFGNEWITVFSIVLTLAILFLSEIIPKSIGANHWKLLVPMAAFLLPSMIILTYPLVYISIFISKLFQKKEIEKVTRGEIQALAKIGLNHGTLEVTEYQILEKLMEFKSITANDVMTKDSKVISLKIDLKSDDISKEITKIKNSRLPVFGVHHDDIRGYVLRTDLLNLIAKKKRINLYKILKPILIVPSYVKLKSLLFKLLDRQEHICAIVDDYGRFVGIVTLENILESLLGIEIIDELD